jgi:hypothetical protein
VKESTYHRGGPSTVFRARLEKLVDICPLRVEFSPQSVSMRFLIRNGSNGKRTC